MLVPVRKTASSWADVAKTNPVASGLTHAQTWAIFQWEAAVADAIVNGTLRQHDGKGVSLALQNEAIEIYTRNLFRTVGRGSPKALRGILETLVTKGEYYGLDHWFVPTPLETPEGWPYYIPAIKGPGKVGMAKTVIVKAKGSEPPVGFKDKAWADLDKHPVLNP